MWGRIRSKKAAAKAESYALEADYEFARQSLAAAVARAYFTTIEAAQQETNAQETLDIYQEYTKLTDIQKQHGFASDFDVSQIKSRTASAEDALYTAQQVRAQTIRAIEVVTSHYPAGRFDLRRSFPGQPRAVPAGLPAQILERRPDLIASERRFAAAFHRVNEARTARLPRFVLSAGSGLGTADLDSVGSLNALVWTFAGGITQPIFFGGELQAAQDLRTAEQKAAAASYVGHERKAIASCGGARPLGRAHACSFACDLRSDQVARTRGGAGLRRHDGGVAGPCRCDRHRLGVVFSSCEHLLRIVVRVDSRAVLSRDLARCAAFSADSISQRARG